MMKRCDLKEKDDGSFNLFPTIHDAVHRAMETMPPICIITDASPKAAEDNGNGVVSLPGTYRRISIIAF